MGDENYQKLLEKIAKASNLAKEEIERKVEAKIAKLSNLISKEGALQIISAELGVNLEDEKFKINELVSGMRKINLIGKIFRLFPVRTFTTKKGEEGKVANMWIADDTSNVKLVLWDTHHIKLIEEGKVKEDSVIEIKNASMRDNEVHLGSFSEFKLSNETIAEVNTERVVKEKPIVDFKVGDNISIRAFIVQSFEPRFFHVCPECSKKVVSGEEGWICAEHGKVQEEKRALINIVIDDGTESIRSVLFHERLADIGLTELEDVEKVIAQREDLLGKEMVFSGNVRMNNFFNNPEFIIEGASQVNLDELIGQLEGK